MIVRNCMKKQVFSIFSDETIAVAARLMQKHHIGTLPVVDHNNRLIGILTLHSLLRIVLPDFVELISNFSFINNLGAFESRIPSEKELNIKVKEIMEEPFFVQDDWGLVHAAAILHNEGLADIPVVDASKHLIGLASHVDIGTAMMRGWNLSDNNIPKK
ncbi:MAG: CBS domain-containing protein [Anaerolineaceae bacterium]|nr:CBS domain-containing protein [Anaerolineaceae bacterium]